MSDPFHKRFNIDVPVEETRQRFINRIENRVLSLMRALDTAGRANSLNVLDQIMLEVESALGESHLTHVSSPGTFIDVWRKRINSDFLRCLLAMERLYQVVSTNFDQLGRQKVDAVVVDSLAQSEIDIGVSWEAGVFLKKGAELLDLHLVNEPLRWLADPKYETAMVPFRKGLSHLLEGTKDVQRYGDAVTDMYEALEAMAKIVTGKPTEELSTLQEQFLSKLRLSDYHKVILKAYVEYGCDFRHAVMTGKQRRWPLEQEAENFVYMTGLFIRLAVQSETHK